MITGIRIKNFKGIRDMERLPLGPFHVLIGANGSGKSTFLEALEFLNSCVVDSPRDAVMQRVPAFRDLTFNRLGGQILLDLWLEDGLEYSLTLSQDEHSGVSITAECLSRNGIILAGKGNEQYIYRDETNGGSYAFNPAYDRLVLSSAPLNRSAHPTANDVRDFLSRAFRSVELDSHRMRQPCSPLESDILKKDGSNFARVFHKLKDADPAGFANWLSHLQLALETVETVGWDRRQADNAEFITVKYKDGQVYPSWLLSDGTLRTLALTILAFFPGSPGIVLVEEPENGVHPRAIEIIMSALQAIPRSQVLVTTHSPLAVQLVGVDKLLCFSRQDDGVHIQSGSNHPALKEWDGVPDLAAIFAARILE